MKLNLLEYWYEALGAEVGIVIQTTDRERLRAHLYTARREACDESLAALSIIFSPTDSSEIWIIKNDQEKGSGTPDAGDTEPVHE